MKYLPLFKTLVIVLLLPAVMSYVNHCDADASLDGAWQAVQGNKTTSMIINDGYCMITDYDQAGRQFFNTRGGKITVENDRIKLEVQFNSADSTEVGKIKTYSCTLQGDVLNTDVSGKMKSYKRTDDGKGELAGNWRITQRKQGDKMVDAPLRARRTLKLLTGTRFQWAAINIENGQFSGTGGGSYTFINGKYTENIEFFSRDNSRVGASLSFDDKVENGNWIHTGLSSTGNPIYEVWSRFKE
ncbi:MAG: hypothetical protein LC128_03585 [Chitinophagales bacterium]|nr:hypothetical protein [Chitinophagales bacterium]